VFKFHPNRNQNRSSTHRRYANTPKVSQVRFHVQIARNNGLTEDEIAEVIYHASGYAGFPAANTACKIAREALEE
jgi:alkylhydroperoxidase/carboxymuconolactone decarboxylase family protein YurZ